MKIDKSPMARYDEYQQEFWDGITKRRHPSHPVVKTMVENKLAAIKDILPDFETSSVLEVGAGNGYYSYYLEKQVQFLETTDFSRNMLSHNPASHKLSANVYALPFRNNSFDIVFEAAMLHHLHDIDRALIEMKRVSKRYIVLLEPNVLNPLMFLFACLKKSERNVMRFTQYFLQKKIREHNLSMVHLVTSGLILPNKMPSFLLPLLRSTDRCKFYFGITHVAICQKLS